MRSACMPAVFAFQKIFLKILFRKAKIVFIFDMVKLLFNII